MWVLLLGQGTEITAIKLLVFCLPLEDRLQPLWRSDGQLSEVWKGKLFFIICLLLFSKKENYLEWMSTVIVLWSCWFQSQIVERSFSPWIKRAYTGAFVTVAGVPNGISFQVCFSSMMARFCQLEALLTRNEAIMKAAGIWIINHKHFNLFFVKLGVGWLIF